MFEKAALTYDQDFTHSNIGKLLRNRVWEYLNSILESSDQLNILELNCGTGEDAIWFAQQGHKVVATDLSEEMVKKTREKVTRYNLQDKIQTFVCDLREIHNCEFSTKFDLIFSNFGGLNCLNRNELKNISTPLFQLLNPRGRFVAVVMPRFCAWESLYFISKFDTQKAFRRNTSNSLAVNVGDEYVETWYYSPTIFNSIFQNHFYKLGTKPIGFAIPPSYMEKRVGRNKKIMDVLNFSESVFGEITSLAPISDHFLIDFQKKNTL